MHAGVTDSGYKSQSHRAGYRSQSANRWLVWCAGCHLPSLHTHLELNACAALVCTYQEAQLIGHSTKAPN
ncbi:hypothetical protein Pcinc_012726 [Petrolisthes cinctipes]|uniref:Uncharacterized protein n=1 Tax=Petrolisthes cinctipes TaxID=88211 RepID=A0AAE1G0E3_PETCI|nr:hypothetical protein Pcinc_012726 [Petrolisthes cinctipes]